MAPLLLLLLLCLLSSALRLDHHGRPFKILQVADMHYANGAQTKCEDVLPEQYPNCSDLNTTAFLERVMAAEMPDLIVFTGDNIYASDSLDPAASLDASFRPAVRAKLPWAAVLGNHDQESSSLNRAGVMAHIAQMDYTLSRVYPIGFNGSSIDGFGNYNLEVFGSHGSDLQHTSVLNLYFVDSGDYSTDPSYPGYGWVKESQQAWFKQVVQSKCREAAPALVFFHIPLPEVINATACSVGERQEAISSPKFNSGFFDTLVGSGDVKAVFTGHDHLNDFCGELNGLHLCYGGGFGYHAYGKAGWSRRARIIEMKQSSGGSVQEITTWKRLDDAAVTIIDKQTLWTSKKDEPENCGQRKLEGEFCAAV